MRDEIKRVLENAFAEDIGHGDITGDAVIPAEKCGEYVFRTREDIIFCGAEVIAEAFGQHAKITVKDGERLKTGAQIAMVKGNVREILRKERTVLNLIQILSGVATETAKYVEAISGTRAKILDTRKTVPGLRILQKYAVKCGGGENHRMGLYDMVMIKDNHIREAGGITKAVKAARAFSFLGNNPGEERAIPKIEVECDTLEQVEEAVAAKPDVILLDNMTVTNLYKAIKIIDGKIPVEASGNISLETIRAIAETGVNFISTSKITMAAKAVDIGLDLLA